MTADPVTAVVVLDQAAIDELEQVTPLVVSEARAIVITNDAELEQANVFLRTRCKAMREQIAGSFGRIKAKAHEAYKEALGQFSRFDSPWAEAEEIVKEAIARYSREQREAAERRLLQQRQAAQALAEQERLERAVHLESQGRQAEALALLDRPAPVAVVAASRPVPKLAGTSIAETWKGQVTDFAALVAAAAADPQYLGLLQPNQVAINQLAKALKRELRVPGVQAVPSDSVRSRA